MRNTANYPLRLPKSLKDEVTKVAKRDGTSVNQFIAMAVAEKVAAMETEQFFIDRAQKADLDAFRAILFRANGREPQPNDRIETSS